MIWLFLILFIPECSNLYFINVPDAYSFWGLCDGEIGLFYETPSQQNETTKKRNNQYTLRIPIRIVPKTVTLLLKFSSEATLEIHNHPNETAISVQKLAQPKNSYGLIFSGNFDAFDLILQVSGPESGDVPYVESVLRDYQEICPNLATGYLDKFIKDGATHGFGPVIDESCGRRQVIHTQLIVHGQSTKSGDWPWHAAILRMERNSFKYICGGTLLSKTLVLTAAHCASIRGNAVIPEILSVHLGKHNLIGGDIGAQERVVFRVITHPNYDSFTQDNDIALLKLKSEAVITDYVQPACLWYKKANNKLPDSQSIFGTVVGWGFTHQNSPSFTLQKTTIPLIPELTCLKRNSTFFRQKLNDNKFCAGFANGTSVCNGDSGGGFMIFVPDAPGTASGGWYVRGIVSIALSRLDAPVCNPYEYTIYTDVEKYLDWLLGHME